MKKLLFAGTVLFSAAIVFATSNDHKATQGSTHQSQVSGCYNFSNDTVPKKDTTKPRRDTLSIRF